MAYNPNIPALANRVQDDIAAMRGNFQHLAPLAQLAPAAGELQAVSALAPYVQAILGSRIVEIGSNSNGEYVRWENGLQVCFATLITSASADTLWTLPAAFLGDVWVTCGGVAATFDVGARVITFQGRTTSGIMLRVLNASGARVNGVVFLIAIGRWK